MTWGCGALIIREVVRRWRGGWTSMLLLGVALAIAEEVLIQQTSLAPLIGVNPANAYGRKFGVNWLYLLFMLGYESVSVVLVPVQFTELMFRDRRHQPWLQLRGLLISGVVFLLGSFIAWFAWTQNYRIKVLHLPEYHPSTLNVLLGVAAIVILTVAAFYVRVPVERKHNFLRRDLPPRLIGIIGFLLMYPWNYLIVLAFAGRRTLPFSIPIIAGLGWASFAFIAVMVCSSTPGWQDQHRLALVAGATTAIMCFGVFAVRSGRLMDIIGQIIFDACATLGIAYLSKRLQHQQPIT